MESVDLRGVRAKINRAQQHLDNINAALRIQLGTEMNARVPTNLDIDYQRKHMIVRFAADEPVEPINPSLPLMVGDCIHNLRSALDHLVFRLALRHGSGAKAAEKTFFPIYLTKSRFDERVENFVKPFISAAALAEIEKCQPYRAYDVPAEADIWILSQLDIIDKHRLLVVAEQKFAATDFALTFTARDGNATRFAHAIANPKWKRMEAGAEIIRFDLTTAIPDAPGKVHVQSKVATTIQFIDTGLACDGTIVNDALAQCVGIVGAIVRDFGKDFFGE